MGGEEGCLFNTVSGSATRKKTKCLMSVLVPTKSLTGTNRKSGLVLTESLDWYQQNVLLVSTESHEWCWYHS